MATKAENLKRLHELAEKLGREPDESGSAADIAQRLAELEEELAGAGEIAGQDEYLQSNDGLTGPVSEQSDIVTEEATDLVTVVALVMLQTDALHATRDEPVEFVLPGTAFRISASVAAGMTASGLAKMQ